MDVVAVSVISGPHCWGEIVCSWTDKVAKLQTLSFYRETGGQAKQGSGQGPECAWR